jgi:hypothetical protein
MAEIDAIDREFEEREAELWREFAESGTRLAGDLDAIAHACARRHPLLFFGGGVAAGACATVAATSSSRGRRLLRGLLGVASGAYRIARSSAFR